MLRSAAAAVLLVFGLVQAAAAGRPRPRRNPQLPPLTCPSEAMSALTCASAEGRLDIVKAILDGGGDVNALDAQGISALHWAARKGNMAMVKMLAARGANVNVRNRNKGTPLHWAAKWGHVDVVNFLISRRADVNARNNQDWTPLLTAAADARRDVVKALLFHHADARAVNASGETAQRLAERKRDFASAKILAAFAGAQNRRPGPNARQEPHIDWVDRKPAPGPAPRPQAPATKPQPAAPAPPAMGKDEMKRMVAQAVKEAEDEQKKAGAPKPVPRSDVDAPRYRLKPNANNYAIVIGIENYSDLPAAEFAERDARAVRDHLVALGYPERNVVSLLGQKAGKAAFVKTLETWLPKNVKEDSTVFFYYSGHGAPDPKSSQSYLVPWDGDPQFLDDTGYPVKRLYDKLGALKAKRVIVAMDSCFSGAGGRSVMAKGLRPLVLKTDSGFAPNGKIISFSASGGEQVSGAIEDKGHGLFTYYFLKGLNGEAKDSSGGVTVKSLYDYLSPSVQDAARRGNREQTPQVLPEATGSAGAVKLR